MEITIFNKIKKILLLPLLGISLIACNSNENNNSSNIEQNETITKQWSNDIQDLMKANLNGYICPYFEIENSSWVYSTYYESIALHKEHCEDNEDIKTFMDAFLSNGFLETTSEYDDGNIWNRYGIKYIDESKNEYLEIHCNRWMKSRELYGVVSYHIDDNTWDGQAISDEIKRVFNIEITMPKPNFSYDHFELEQMPIEFGNVVFHLFGEDHADDYKTQLLNEGFTSRKDVFGEYFFDETKTIECIVSYEEDNTNVSIQGYHGN